MTTEEYTKQYTDYLQTIYDNPELCLTTDIEVPTDVESQLIDGTRESLTNKQIVLRKLISVGNQIRASRIEYFQQNKRGHNLLTVWIFVVYLFTAYSLYSQGKGILEWAMFTFVFMTMTFIVRIENRDKFPYLAQVQRLVWETLRIVRKHE